jgi:hypothetical protein
MSESISLKALFYGVSPVVSKEWIPNVKLAKAPAPPVTV